MNPITLIALNTVREHLRDKLLYSAALFALALIAGAGLLSRLSVGEYQRILLDLGLAAMNLVGVLIALFIGISVLGREKERRTLYLIVTKPVPRFCLVVGKYLGLLVTLFLVIVLMGFGLMAVMWLTNEAPTAGLLVSLLGIYLECAVVAAIALIFSTYTTMTLSAMYTVALYVVGHSASSLRALSQSGGDLTRWVMTGIAYVLPDLEKFNLKTLVLVQLSIPTADIVFLITYAAAYVGALLTIAVMIVQRSDLQ